MSEPFRDPKKFPRLEESGEVEVKIEAGDREETIKLIDKIFGELSAMAINPDADAGRINKLLQEIKEIDKENKTQDGNRVQAVISEFIPHLQAARRENVPVDSDAIGKMTTDMERLKRFIQMEIENEARA